MSKRRKRCELEATWHTLKIFYFGSLVMYSANDNPGESHTCKNWIRDANSRKCQWRPSIRQAAISAVPPPRGSVLPEYLPCIRFIFVLYWARKVPPTCKRHLGFEYAPDMYAQHGEHRPVRPAACAVRGDLYIMVHAWRGALVASGDHQFFRRGRGALAILH
jgi:hypothetical protein